MLAIPLISAECEYMFSSAKYLFTDPRNRLKADIIKANKCLKSWFRRPQVKAFKKGVNPNIDKQYKEEEAAAKSETDTVGNTVGNSTGNTVGNITGDAEVN